MCSYELTTSDLHYVSAVTGRMFRRFESHTPLHGRSRRGHNSPTVRCHVETRPSSGPTDTADPAQHSMPTTSAGSSCRPWTDPGQHRVRNLLPHKGSPGQRHVLPNTRRTVTASTYHRRRPERTDAHQISCNTVSPARFSAQDHSLRTVTTLQPVAHPSRTGRSAVPLPR